MYCVYKHTFPNNKIYIGITCRKPEHRWNHGRGYLEKNKNGEYNQPAIARAILKYGWENVEHEVLFDGLPKEEAEQKEIELIREYQSNDHEFGYNITIGGGMPNHIEQPVFCEETRCVYNSFNDAEKQTGISAGMISRACRGKSKTAGKKHWRFISKEEIEKLTLICVDCGISFIKNNLKTTRQTRCPNCQKEHRRRVARERKQDYRKRKIEQGDNFKPETSSHKQHELEKQRLLIYCVEANFYYSSLEDASKSFNVEKEDILNALHDNQKTIGGFHWRYVEKERNGDKSC